MDEQFRPRPATLPVADDSLDLRMTPPASNGGAGDDVKALSDLSRPAFKTLVTSEGRVGVRMEMAFWNALDAVDGQTRRSLAVEVLSLARQMGINATSALRCVIVSRLQSRVERASGGAIADRALALMQAAPVPSFAFDRNLRIVCCNAEFTQDLAATTEAGGAEALPENARIVLDCPISALLSRLEGGAVREESLVIRIGAEERRVRARVMAVDQEARMLVQAYVLKSDRNYQC